MKEKNYCATYDVIRIWQWILENSEYAIPVYNAKPHSLVQQKYTLPHENSVNHTVFYI